MNPPTLNDPVPANAEGGDWLEILREAYRWPDDGRTAALADILRERQHQIERGHPPEADARHVLGDLSRAATACLVAADDAGQHGAMFAQYFWPFHWEGVPGPRHGRRRLLVKAAALILAELERLPREASPPAATLLIIDQPEPR